MKSDSNDEQVKRIGEGLLWAVVGNYAETHLELLKETLRPAGNMDSEAIDKITVLKVRETDEFIVNEFSAQDGILTVKYEMPAVILAKSDDEAVCCMKPPISENRTILGITCIPYIVILFVVFYCYTVGFGWMDSYSDGWWGVFNGLVLIGASLIYTPLGILLLVCILYQIIYFVNWCEKRDEKKNNRVNTSDD